MMKGTFRHIVFMLVAVAFVAGCSRGARLIPRSKLADIYVDMYLADQWMIIHPEEMRTADSLLVYVPILREHGYTLEDYRYTVDKYSLDPERFAKILSKVADEFHERFASTQRLAKDKDSWSELLRKMDRIKPAYQIYDSLFVGTLDTYKVDLQMDSMSRYVANKVLPLWVPNGPGITRRDRWMEQHESADSAGASVPELEDTVKNVNVPDPKFMLQGDPDLQVVEEEEEAL